MTLTFRNPALIVLGAAIAGTVALAPAPVPVRVALALPLALFLPGYALACALFPANTSFAAHLPLSIGLSVAVCVIGGFALHWAPDGLTAAFLAFLFVGVSVAAAVAAWLRHVHRETPATKAWRVRVPLPRRSALMVLAAAVLAGLAVAVARTPLPAKGIPGYTTLWLLPGKPGSNAVRVGMTSGEHQTASYRLELRAAGRRAVVLRVRLGPGDRWNAVVDVASVPLRRRSFEALLYRTGAQPSPYRRATLVLPGSTLPPTTDLWLLRATPGSSTIRISVTSAELRKASFRLELRAGGRLAQVARLTLAPGERWNTFFDADSVPTRRRAFEALLYRSGKAESKPAYRRATLVFPGSLPLPARAPAREVSRS